MRFLFAFILLIPAPIFASAPSVPIHAPVLDAPFATPVGLKIEPTKPKPKPVAKKPAVKKKKTVTKRKAAPKPKPRKIVYSLKGTWDWVAVCPVIGKVTGVTTYEGGTSGKYTGRIKTSLDQRAKHKTTLKGRDFVQVERFGLIRVTGQHRLDSNGRSFSGRVNNGCSVTGKRRG